MARHKEVVWMFPQKNRAGEIPDHQKSRWSYKLSWRDWLPFVVDEMHVGLAQVCSHLTVTKGWPMLTQISKSRSQPSSVFGYWCYFSALWSSLDFVPLQSDPSIFFHRRSSLLEVISTIFAWAKISFTVYWDKKMCRFSFLARAKISSSRCSMVSKGNSE